MIALYIKINKDCHWGDHSSANQSSFPLEIEGLPLQTDTQNIIYHFRTCFLYNYYKIYVNILRFSKLKWLKRLPDNKDNVKLRFTVFDYPFWYLQSFDVFQNTNVARKQCQSTIYSFWFSLWYLHSFLNLLTRFRILMWSENIVNIYLFMSYRRLNYFANKDNTLIGNLMHASCNICWHEVKSGCCQF